MIHTQYTKYARCLEPVSVAGGGTATTQEVDTRGFDYAKWVVFAGAVGANGVTTVKMQETDTSGSGHADIPGAAFTAMVDADDNVFLVCHIDLQSRKRFLKPVIVNGATNASLLSSWVELTRPDESPDNITERGVAQQLFV